MPAISVIVPVYKVEKYLRRCVDSIISQSFTDLEILLLDDGSPDNCGAICDEYARQDSRVRVVHKQNEGLSQTRNLGIALATGEYVSFIDSDDYILPGTYSSLWPLAQEHNADMVCFCHIDRYGDGREVHHVKKPFCITLDTVQALDALLFPQYVDVITCNKLIRRELYTGIEYPRGKLYEDMYTTYKLVDRAKAIVCTSLEKYVYCHRADSIGGRAFSKETMSLAAAADACGIFAKTKFGDKAVPNMAVGVLFWNIVVANYMIKAKQTDNAFIKPLQKEVRAKAFRILRCPYLSLLRKMQMLLFGCSRPLYVRFYLRYIANNR